MRKETVFIAEKCSNENIRLVMQIGTKTQRDMQKICSSSLPHLGVHLLITNIISFIVWLDSPHWARASSLSRLHNHTQTHTHTHTHSVGLFWTSDRPPSKRPLPDNTQRSQDIDIYILSGIQTRKPRKRATVDPHLRPQGVIHTYLFKLFTS